MVIRPLLDSDDPYPAFAEAFGDYVVKLSPSREQLTEMLTRRGYAAAASIGAFEDERMVAFTLNGIDGAAAYDTGTGVVPSHRRRGLGLAVMQASIDRLRELGFRRYLLEVIESNHVAEALYRGLGFRETRRFDCWRYSWSGGEDAPAPAAAPLPRAAFDVEPSWQSSDASIARAREPHVTLGDARGFAVVFPGSGDLAQLFVDRAHRRRGLGTRLLRQAASAAGKPLRILNVDDRDAGIAAFLAHNGAERFIRQIEMELSL